MSMARVILESFEEGEKDGVMVQAEGSLREVIKLIIGAMAGHPFLHEAIEQGGKIFHQMKQDGHSIGKAEILKEEVVREGHEPLKN